MLKIDDFGSVWFFWLTLLTIYLQLDLKLQATTLNANAEFCL